MPHLFFKSGVIDPVFNLFIFLGLSFIIEALLADSKKRRRFFALSGLCIGLATLTKGPVALLVIILTMMIYWAGLRFKPFVRRGEIAVFLLVTTAVAGIFFGIETLSHGTTFIRSFIAYQLRLFSTADAGQGRPFYFHFFVILFGCFPASFFAILSFSKRHEPGGQAQSEKFRLGNRLMFILFWVVLILFSIVKTKTVLYSSLTWFPVTYLAAVSLQAIIQKSLPLSRSIFYSLAAFALLLSVAITFFPISIIHREWIIPLIPDKFAVACLANPVRWSGFEFLLGIGYAFAVAVSLFLFAKARPAAGTVGLFGSSALCILLFSATFAGKIERYCQGGPVAFYKAHANGDDYTRSLFKSYTDLFYSRVKRDADPRSRNRAWLLRGPIDKPAYFVCRTTEANYYDGDTALHLTKIKEQYGFSYYRRDVPSDRIARP